MLIDEYRTSLKHPEAEEVFDLIAFRPLGFVIARALRQTSLTPNHITTASLIVGIAAAVLFSQATPFLAWGALLYTITNLLDCADGQLARLQQSGTQFGRIWDGVADYIVTVAVFLGLGFAMADWWLVVAAGFSSAVHAAVFDYFQSAFVAANNGAGDFLQNERRRYEEERHKHRKKLKSLFVQIYLLYLGIQQRTTANIFSQQNISGDMVRLWSFLGPTTNRTVLIVCALFGDVEFFLWMVAVGGNVWMMACSLLQRRTRHTL